MPWALNQPISCCWLYIPLYIPVYTHCIPITTWKTQIPSITDNKNSMDCICSLCCLRSRHQGCGWKEGHRATCAGGWRRSGVWWWRKRDGCRSQITDVRPYYGGHRLKPHDESTSSHLSWEDHHKFRPLGVQLRLELGTTMVTNPITIVIYRLITGTALENYCLQRFKRLI